MVEAGCTRDPINRLQKKGLIESETRREMSAGTPLRWQLSDGEAEQSHTLTDDQTHALDRITSALDSAKAATFAAARRHGQRQKRKFTFARSSMSSALAVAPSCWFRKSV